MSTPITPLDYTVVHHANMLADQKRLQAVEGAIFQATTPEAIVVNIGAGTGILAATSATFKKNTVYAIEYYSFGAELATKLFKKNFLNNAIVYNQSSYDTLLPLKPNILVTETIGQIAPEENIVEVCFDFCQRYPSIHTWIPYKLSLYAKFIHSNFGKLYQAWTQFVNLKWIT